ncbi:hypothetical protein [Halobaculum litoreum]|uniref:Uncharacterized protein n=1 Tax=Halobaculum litoreum TaxID=3031998 RepID=A0ABD5XQU4_9EURY|nr:hypothetical protein [Halobaculum sp. DT92]
MGGIVSGLSGRIVGAGMALSASVSVPALPYVPEVAADWGLAELPVVVGVVTFVAVRLALGVALVVRGGEDARPDPLAFGRPDEPGAVGALLSRLRSRR